MASMIGSLCVMNWREYSRKRLWPVEGAQRLFGRMDETQYLENCM